MEAKKQAETAPEGEKTVRHQLHAIIGEQVLHALGQPIGLQKVQVRCLWDDRYRVNVLIGTDVVSAVVAHSYFLVADHEGNIIAANPKILKRY